MRNNNNNNKKRVITTVSMRKLAIHQTFLNIKNVCSIFIKLLINTKLCFDMPNKHFCTLLSKRLKIVKGEIYELNKDGKDYCENSNLNNSTKNQNTINTKY
eukprot:m.45520 g.45520  ORF g.45520 m.45520 type:complete len:101 (-) comp7225_c0_seq7:84-386(-)